MKALVRATPRDRIIQWPLLWRNPNQCWHSQLGRILQIGDSAHFFLPSKSLRLLGTTLQTDRYTQHPATAQHKPSKTPSPSPNASNKPAHQHASAPQSRYTTSSGSTVSRPRSSWASSTSNATMIATSRFCGATHQRSWQRCRNGFGRTIRRSMQRRDSPRRRRVLERTMAFCSRILIFRRVMRRGTGRWRVWSR